MLISSPARRSIRKLNTTFERNSNETNFDEFFKLCIFIMFATKKAICNIYAADFVNIYNNIQLARCFSDLFVKKKKLNLHGIDTCLPKYTQNYEGSMQISKQRSHQSNTCFFLLEYLNYNILKENSLLLSWKTLGPFSCLI